MFKTIRNAWKIADLRKKLIFTVLILLVYRIGNAIPVPFVDSKMMADYFQSELANTVLGLYNAMSGSAFAQASVLALGIQPYINASIIVQLLSIAIPALERMAKEEGEAGKKKIDRITRIVTVVLGIVMGYGYYTMISGAQGFNLLTGTVKVWTPIIIVSAFTAGSCIVMWMGEQITEHGIGNGISMILFANIIAGLPTTLSALGAFGTKKEWWIIAVVSVLLMLMIVFIVFINDAERRIPIQYAKRVVGRKVYGGQNTNLPIKVAMSGVMPVIFAQTICTIPATICTFIGKTNGWWYKNIFAASSWVYIVFYGLMIFFFSWFYSTIQYDPVEISNNLKKNGGFIPGFRPGKPTAEFIQKVINKIIIFGAVYLAIVAGLPMVASNTIPNAQKLAIGGTSVIIVVGVALETVKALEAQMLMRHYKGFLD